ncbi:MAG: PD-(D/E)XK nuclease-like domain-containing protein [Nitrospirales bacterium]
MNKPGIYRDISVEEYERADAARSTTLRLFDRSAAHARQSILEPRAPTTALDLGTGLHSAVLEPDRFEQEYVAVPKVDRRTKVGKEAWARFIEEHPDQERLPQEDYDKCLKVRDALAIHSTAHELLSGQGFNEVSVMWRERTTGMMCKARLDRLTLYSGYPCIMDLKSARDASIWGFGKAIADYELHFQAAMYLDGLDTLSPQPRRFVFLVIEAFPPWAIGTYELRNEALELGRNDYLRALQLFKNARDTNVWPGYREGLREIDVPPWKYRKDSEYGDSF